MAAGFIPPERQSGRGTVWMSKKAAMSCLEMARINPAELELLVFAGIYREKHIGEPSVSSLIQNAIGANPSIYPLDKRTFSFDLNSGGCGLVNTIQIIDGFISSGKLSCGMIITGDSEPVKGLSQGYRFKPAVSSVILKKSEAYEGFKMIRSYTFPQYRDDFRSYIQWVKRKGLACSKNILVVEQSASYTGHCLESCLVSCERFLEEAGLRGEDIDLVIPSQSPSGLPTGLKKCISGSPAVIILNGSGRGEFHTSGPGLALREAWKNGAFSKARNILFLTVGAGINVSIAWYVNGGKNDV